MIKEDIIERKTEEPELNFQKNKFIKMVICFFGGLICSVFPQKYEISPFASAFCIAVSADNVAYCFSGAVLGYIISRGIKEGLIYIFLLCFCVAGKTLCSRRLKSSISQNVSGFLSCIFVIIFDILRLYLTNELEIITALLAVTDGAICLLSSFFFSKTFKIKWKQTGFSGLSKHEITSTAVSMIIFSFCSGSLAIKGIYPFRIIACVIIMMMAFYSGIGLSSASSIIFGAVLSISSENYRLFPLYALGGLFCGIVYQMGQFVIPIVFSVSSVCIFFLTGADTQGLYMLSECIVSSLIFLAIPPKKLNAFVEFLKSGGLKNDNDIQFQATKNINKVASSIEEMKKILDDASQKKTVDDKPEINRIFALVQHSVCTHCDKKEVCWNENFIRTKTFIKILLEKRFSFEEINPKEIDYFCGSIDRIWEEIKRFCQNYSEQEHTRIKCEELRCIATDQFSSMAEILKDIANQISSDNRYDQTKTRAAKTALNENGISVHRLTYCENSAFRASVELEIIDEIENINCEKIMKILSLTVGRRFCEPKISVSDFFTVLKFKEKASYSIKSGFCQIPFGNNNICGDSVEIFQSEDLTFYGVLCDGMGTGQRAYIDGQTASRLIHKLLSGGFSLSCGLELVNCALIIRGNDESLSTVDIFALNPYNAMGTFFKAGAAASYIRHADSVTKVEEGSLPIGILRTVSFAERKVQLYKNDVVLIISDGADSNDDLWICDYLLSWSTDNMQELSTHIASSAKKKNEKNNPDDITVMAFKVKEIP